MRKSPDLMLILSLAVFVGFSVTAMVQAKAAEISSTGMDRLALDAMGNRGSHTNSSELVDISIRDYEIQLLQKDQLPKNKLTVNLHLGVNYQGDAYSLSTGYMSASELITTDNYLDRGGLRYGFVTVGFGW